MKWKGMSDFLMAVFENRFECVGRTLSFRPEAVEANEGTGTALSVAIAAGSVEAARELLKAGADTEADGETSLLRAATSSSEEMVLLLLEHGAKKGMTDVSGWTELIWSTSRGHARAASLMLEDWESSYSKRCVGEAFNLAAHRAMGGELKCLYAFLGAGLSPDDDFVERRLSGGADGAVGRAAQSVYDELRLRRGMSSGDLGESKRRAKI